VNRLNTLKNNMLAALTAAMLSVEARADNQLQLNNIAATTGAGSNDITALMSKGQNVAQSGVNFLLIAFAAIGIALVALSLYGIYRAQKDQRESPKVAITGIIVGTCLTSVALIVGLMRNTINVN
jgi:Na+-driven multidrug efflux pump